MNALELADKLKKYSLTSGYAWYCHKAADEIRRQHEAIVQLREALTELSGMYVVHHNAATRAKKALKDTEEFQ